jgi:hypothetical protein
MMSYVLTDFLEDLRFAGSPSAFAPVCVEKVTIKAHFEDPTVAFLEGYRNPEFTVDRSRQPGSSRLVASFDAVRNDDTAGTLLRAPMAHSAPP